MTQMFAAVHYPFGRFDKDEGADSVTVYGISSDRQKLIDWTRQALDDNCMKDVEAVEGENEVEIKARFDEEDEQETYFVISPVEAI